MVSLTRDCEMFILTDEDDISDFDCGNADLNEFFNQDAIQYRHQMLSRTCFYRYKSNGTVVCAFSFSAGSIKTSDLPGSRRKKVKECIPSEKSLKSYPALLIVRLGVATEFTGRGVGSQVIDAIKNLCLMNFPDFVRFRWLMLIMSLL